MRPILLLVLPVLLSGCLARTAVGVVTLPVKVVGAGVDAVTTSQAEADQRRGREMREEEERIGREARRREREERRRRREAADEAESGEYAPETLAAAQAASGSASSARTITPATAR